VIVSSHDFFLPVDCVIFFSTATLGTNFFKSDFYHIRLRVAHLLWAPM